MAGQKKRFGYFPPGRAGFSKVTRCKSETASGRDRRNGYVRQKQQAPAVTLTGQSAPADFQLFDAAANDRVRHRHVDRRAVLFVVDARRSGVVVPWHSPHHVAGGEGGGAQEWAGWAQQPDASSLRIGQSGRWSPWQCSTRSCRVSRSWPSSRIFWFSSSMC